MSQAANPSPGSKSVPQSIASGIVGFALGAGITFLVMHFYGPMQPAQVSLPFSSSSPTPAGGQATVPGGMPGGVGSGPSGDAGEIK